MNDIERFLHRLVQVLEGRDPAGVHRPVGVDDLRRRIMPYRLNRSAIGLSSIEDYELMILRIVSEEGGYVRTFPPESVERARAEATALNPDLDVVETFDDTTIQIGAHGLARILESAASAPSPPPVEPVGTEPLAAGAHGPGAIEPSAAAGETSAPVELAAPGDLPEPKNNEPESERPEPIVPEPDVVFEPIADSIAVDEPAVSPGRGPVLGSHRSSVAICPFCGLSLPTHREVSFCPHCGDRLGPERCVKCGSEVEKGWRHCVSCGHPARRGTVA